MSSTPNGPAGVFADGCHRTNAQVVAGASSSTVDVIAEPEEPAALR